MDETFPDLGSLTDVELKDLIRQLTEEETEISYKRRILHGKIDILRAELVNRLRKKHDGGEIMITGEDVQQLTDILADRQLEHRRGGRLGVDEHSPALGDGSTAGQRPPTGARTAGRRAPRPEPTAMALHCTECGFVNGEGANYCQRCGALLERAEGARTGGERGDRRPRPTASTRPASSCRSRSARSPRTARRCDPRRRRPRGRELRGRGRAA